MNDRKPNSAYQAKESTNYILLVGTTKGISILSLSYQ